MEMPANYFTPNTSDTVITVKPKKWTWSICDKEERKNPIKEIFIYLFN